jgi:hypothetical protein
MMLIVATLAQEDEVAHPVVGGVVVGMVDLKTISRVTPAAGAVAFTHAAP